LFFNFLFGEFLKLETFVNRFAKFMEALETRSILLLRDTISDCNLGQAPQELKSLAFEGFETLMVGDYLGGVTSSSFFRDACSLLKFSKSFLILVISLSKLRIVLFCVPIVLKAFIESPSISTRMFGNSS